MALLPVDRDSSVQTWAKELDGVHEDDHNSLHAAYNAAIGGPVGASFVIGAQGGDIINIGIVLEDADGNALTEVANVIGFLSDDIAGLDVSGTAPDGTFVIGTDGFLVATITAKLVFLLQSDVIGAIDLDITETGADTWYFVVVLASGVQVVSPAIVIT